MIDPGPLNGQPVAPPPVDPGNTLLGPTPAAWGIAQVSTPQGPALLVTIRTPSTTLTVFVGRDEAIQVAGQIRRAAQAMSGLVVP